MYNGGSFMDTVTIGKKEYKKATLVARDFGYTKDYLGQLCRGEKVDARLVGRTWYVNPESITEHKKNKQRSNLEKSKKALRESVVAKVAVRQATPKNFFDHLPTATKITRYESDDADLVPVVKKKEQSSHRLEVDLADAAKLSVDSTSGAYIISTPKHSKIRFTGDVNVEAVEDTEVEAQVTEDVSRGSDTDPDLNQNPNRKPPRLKNRPGVSRWQSSVENKRTLSENEQ